MFKRIITILLLGMFVTGCTTSKAYNYAEYHSSLSGSQNMTFYSQYDIAYKVQTKKGKVVTVVSPFLADSNAYLPEKVVKLHLGLKVLNPNKESFGLWVESECVGIDTDYYIQIRKFVGNSRMLPENIISIDLPHQTDLDSQVTFRVSVIVDGDTLYESTTAKYRIKGSKKNSKEKERL